MSEEKNHYNVAIWDSIIRIVVSIAVLATSAFVSSFGWKLAMGVGGYLLFTTGIFSFCPLYTLFGFNSRPAEAFPLEAAG